MALVVSQLADKRVFKNVTAGFFNLFPPLSS